jgi:HlyD family secretion protein
MKLRLVFPAVAVVVLALALASIVRAQPAEDRLAPPSPPPVSSYDRSVSGAGIVEPSSEVVSVGVPVPGLVDRVAVRAGQEVALGEVLFVLDTRDLRAELEVRKASLRSAAAALDRLRALPRAETLPPARARVAEAGASLDDARTQLGILKAVADPRAVRKEDLEKRAAAVRVAEARRAGAESDLSLLEAGAWKSDLDVAEAEVRRADAEVRRVEVEIDRRTITAPLAGEVLKVDVRAGEYASPESGDRPMMLLGASGALHVRVDVDEADAWRVRAGSGATAFVRGNASVHAPLSFVRFEPLVVPKRSLTGGVGERVDTRVLQALYRLERGALPVFVGQQVDVYLDAAPAGSKDGNVTVGGAR